MKSWASPVVLEKKLITGQIDTRETDEGTDRGCCTMP